MNAIIGDIVVVFLFCFVLFFMVNLTSVNQDMVLLFFCPGSLSAILTSVKSLKPVIRFIIIFTVDLLFPFLEMYTFGNNLKIFLQSCHS